MEVAKTGDIDVHRADGVLEDPSTMSAKEDMYVSSRASQSSADLTMGSTIGYIASTEHRREDADKRTSRLPPEPKYVADRIFSSIEV